MHAQHDASDAEGSFVCLLEDLMPLPANTTTRAQTAQASRLQRAEHCCNTCVCTHLYARCLQCGRRLCVEDLILRGRLLLVLQVSPSCTACPKRLRLVGSCHPFPPLELHNKASRLSFPCGYIHTQGATSSSRVFFLEEVRTKALGLLVVVHVRQHLAQPSPPLHLPSRHPSSRCKRLHINSANPHLLPARGPAWLPLLGSAHGMHASMRRAAAAGTQPGQAPATVPAIADIGK